MVEVSVAEAYRRVDASVVERARGGDRGAFERLAQDTAQRLYPVAFRMTRDRELADEAVRRAIVTIWKELPKLADSARFGAWSYRIVLRSCTIALRRRARSSRTVAELLRSDPSMSGVDSVADRGELERAFRRLSADHRAVVVLTYYLGLTGDEAAEVLGISRDLVAARLQHALRSMHADIYVDERVAVAQVQR